MTSFEQYTVRFETPEFSHMSEQDKYLQGICDWLFDHSSVIAAEEVYKVSDKRYSLEQVEAWIEDTNNG